METTFLSLPKAAPGTRDLLVVVRSAATGVIDGIRRDVPDLILSDYMWAEEDVG